MAGVFRYTRITFRALLQFRIPPPDGATARALQGAQSTGSALIALILIDDELADFNDLD